MLYTSTRGGVGPVNSSTAITRGISSDGGLFVPHEFPQISNDNLLLLKELSYQDVAKKILCKFLSDYTIYEVDKIVNKAYGTNFNNTKIAPLIKLSNDIFVCELWHGPTSAFKDIALQLLPSLMSNSLKKCNIDEKIIILVATSGDTGKAALEGFCDVDKTEVVVYYPKHGVSDIQYLQMATQRGDNTNVIAVEGNFDDTQNGVKKIFKDKELNKNLFDKGYRLSSANSINWGRLLPQIVYYFTSYLAALNVDEIKSKTLLDFVVPTGNFGNILAGYYAKKMGLPIGKLICASNSNKVLYDFMNTGEYNINRNLTKTISPSMDIIISSNFERLLYAASNNDSKFVVNMQTALKNDNCYSVPENIMNIIKSDFQAGWADEDETKKSIKNIWNQYNYLIDPHTAVGFSVLGKIKRSKNKCIVMSTANPYKFASSVLDALTSKKSGNGFKDMQDLIKITSIVPPENLVNLKGKEILHKKKCNKNEMQRALIDIL